jgi:hypothetical protein
MQVLSLANAVAGTLGAARAGIRAIGQGERISSLMKTVG